MSRLNKTNTKNYLPRSLALISWGFFLFSSAKTTVSWRPWKTWPSIWYLASPASAGSRYWINPKPRGSLWSKRQSKQEEGTQKCVRHHQITARISQNVTPSYRTLGLFEYPSKNMKAGKFKFQNCTETDSETYPND